MAVRFILMMALMMVGSADPVPDPDVRVDVEQIVNARCGGGCCDDDCDSDKLENGIMTPELGNVDGCTPGQTKKEGCAELFCNIVGDWVYIRMDPSCGECIVAAEPWVNTFNPVKGQYVNTHYRGNWYRTNKPGSTTTNPVEYVLTQNGRTTTTSPTFGVNGNFYYATGWPGNHGNGSYVNGITYTDDSGFVEWSCLPGDNTDLTRPCKGFVLKYKRMSILRSDLPFTSQGIWIFPVADDPRECIIIAGNVGLTVMVCMAVKTPITQPDKSAVDIYLPYVYIYASSSLAYTLYGICNTFTGTGITLATYIGRFASYLAGTCALSDNDWIIEGNVLCSGFMDNWKA